MTDPAPADLARRVEAALAALAALPPGARDTAEEAVAAVAQVHGAALARVLEVLRDRAPSVVGQLADDELVAHVLVVHGLHPNVDGEALAAATGPTSAPTAPVADRAGTRDGDGTVWIPVESVTRRTRPPAEPLPAADAEACDLCAAPLGPGHRHLLDTGSGDVACACGACAVLFDRDEVGTRFRRIPDRRLAVGELDLGNDEWAALGVPVGLAFFVVERATGEVRALFPSPAGTTEDRLPNHLWDRLVERAPVLAGMEPDVEALAVHRVRGARHQWVLPIDDCYRLVAELRGAWQGITGGTEVWKAVDRFFDRLGRPEKEHAHG